MIDFLTSVLLHISNALLVPVIIAIILMLVWTTLLLGGFLREWFERRSLRPALEAAVIACRHHEPPTEIWRATAAINYGLPRRFTAFTGEGAREARLLEQALTVLENTVASSVARHSFITRMSPILGLMGTLIPLGPALSGLASGNMQSLAGNLIVAFTATVVGLLISGVAYGMGLARRTWYAHDLSSLEYIVDNLALPGAGGEQAHGA